MSTETSYSTTSMLSRFANQWVVGGILLLALTCSIAFGQTKAKTGTAKLAVSSTPEAQDLMKALRSIESHVKSGVTYDDYGRAVGDLQVAVDAFDELLQSRKEEKLRKQLAEAFAPYQDAKVAWEISYVGDSIASEILLFSIEPRFPAGSFYLGLMDKYPELNVPLDQGGIRDRFEKSSTRVFRDDLLSGLWKVAEKRNKEFRVALAAI